MYIVYVFLIFGSINFICVFAACPFSIDEGVSMFFNDVKIENGGTYEYNSDTKLTVTCRSVKRKPGNGSGNSPNILSIVRTHKLPQNQEGITPKNKIRDESFYDGSSQEISHTFDLGPSDNGLRISCARKYKGDGVSTILIMKLSNLTEKAPTVDFDTISFAKGIGIGIAIIIFLALLCWVIIAYHQSKQPRPRLATPLPETEYYTSVYSWRNPVDPPNPPLTSKPPSDIIKALQNCHFSSKPPQPPTKVNQNLRIPQKQSLPLLGSNRGEVPPDLTQARFSKPSIPSHVAPDVTLTHRNLRFPSNPPHTSQPPGISRPRQLTLPALQMAKL